MVKIVHQFIHLDIIVHLQKQTIIVEVARLITFDRTIPPDSPTMQRNCSVHQAVHTEIHSPTASQLQGRRRTSTRTI